MRCHGVCNISYLFREAQRQDRALIALNSQGNVRYALAGWFLRRFVLCWSFSSYQPIADLFDRSFRADRFLVLSLQDRALIALNLQNNVALRSSRASRYVDGEDCQRNSRRNVNIPRSVIVRSVATPRLLPKRARRATRNFVCSRSSLCQATAHLSCWLRRAINMTNAPGCLSAKRNRWHPGQSQ